jgi:hypothetical protein
MRRLTLHLLALFALLVPSPRALAEVRTTVDVGWSNYYRAGRWTPLFLTLTDTKQPRQVVVEIYAPTDRRYAMKINQGLAIGPSAVTVPLYVPLTHQLDVTTVTVRDANSFRTLDSIQISENQAWVSQDVSQGPVIVDSGRVFIGLSGNTGTQHLVEGQFDRERTAVGYLSPARLPAVPSGYEGLDVLMLNQPDLAKISRDQQQAIVAWVRSGGVLVLWPGPEPLPAAGSPLLDILPCQFGENVTYDIPTKSLDHLHLPSRFAKLKGRTVSSVATDALRVPLFGQNVEPVAYRHWVGFGQVLAIPVDVSTFTFARSGSAPGMTFWRGALRGVVALPENSDDSRNDYAYDQYDDPRRVRAQRQSLDWLGDVPGAGKFGFSYLAFTLLAMMLVVGPIDWFVLKRLGRQPWTWVTTSGWIAFVTLGAIYIGNVLRSGDVYFRTLTVADQAGGSRVAAVDVAAIYSPQTRQYDIGFDPDTWWRPMADTSRYSGGNMLTEIECHQDYRGCRPTPMLVNVWNLRFLQGADYAEAAPLISSKLARRGNAIEGTLTNQSERPLSDIVVRSRAGTFQVKDPIAPGATLKISGVPDPLDRAYTTTRPSAQQRWQIMQEDAPSTRPSVPVLSDLAVTRSDRIEQMLAERADLACVFARFEPGPERVTLKDEPEMIQSRAGVLRAVVPVE